MAGITLQLLLVNPHALNQLIVLWTLWTGSLPTPLPAPDRLESNGLDHPGVIRITTRPSP